MGIEDVSEAAKRVGFGDVEVGCAESTRAEDDLSTFSLRWVPGHEVDRAANRVGAKERDAADTLVDFRACVDGWRERGRVKIAVLPVAHRLAVLQDQDLVTGIARSVRAAAKSACTADRERRDRTGRTIVVALHGETVLCFKPIVDLERTLRQKLAICDRETGRW